MNHNGSTAAAHVLIFPLPLQGHVNSMLNLAEILCLSDFHVTLLLTDYSHRRVATLQPRFSRYGAQFDVATISDGLPEDYPWCGEHIMDMILSLKKVGEAQFRRLMESHGRGVSCVIIDGVMSFVIPVAEQLGIPFIYFRTISACAFWTNFCTQEIMAAGELPLKDKNEDKETFWRRKEMDMMVTSVPGMETILRRRDISGFLRVDDVNDPGLLVISTESRRASTASGFILNTFEDLEGPILDEIHKCIPNLYSIGPLHALLKSLLNSKGFQSSHHTGSFWEEDRSCIAWLDSQPTNSVVYVNFGSLTMLTRGEFLEFWHGLVNSGHRFLWAVRPESVGDSDILENEVPVELKEGTKLRGCMVKWVPQQEILMHRAIGAFFTHSGWNSILESIVIGLPMVCWAYFADQTTNSRYASEVWKIGLDIKDSCDRNIIEKAVRDVMEVKREELSRRACEISVLAREAISEGGSSHSNLNRLIEFLKFPPV